MICGADGCGALQTKNGMCINCYTCTITFCNRAAYHEGRCPHHKKNKEAKCVKPKCSNVAVARPSPDTGVPTLCITHSHCSLGSCERVAVVEDPNGRCRFHPKGKEKMCKQCKTKPAVLSQPGSGSGHGKPPQYCKPCFTGQFRCQAKLNKKGDKCGTLKLEGFKFCEKHKCEHDGCKNEKNQGKNLCGKHYYCGCHLFNRMAAVRDGLCQQCLDRQ